MHLESEVFLLLVIGLIIGHLLLAFFGARFLSRKVRKKFGPFWGYIICSLISFYLLLNAIYGERVNTAKYFFPVDNSICMAFFGIFWLFGIIFLIMLIKSLD